MSSARRNGAATYIRPSRDPSRICIVVNLGAKRLGTDGPHNMADTTAFPPAQYQMVDCTNYKDYDFNFLSSHQYYRLSLQVRSIIAAAMGPQPVA